MNVTIDSMFKTGLKGRVQVFSVGYNTIDTNNILSIHRYLIKETWYKIMFEFIKKYLLGYEALAQ